MREEKLALEHVTKQFGQKNNLVTALEDVSLAFKAGEVSLIIGPSGSGKSTLLGLLAGLDLPTSGSVELFGQTINGLDEDQRAALRLGRVGFVFQSFHLLENLTALENVLLPLELGSDNNQLSEKAQQALQQVGLGERMGHYPAQLSGGEQQRVALARAFVTHPQILFADEPTGNLDRATGQDISNLLFTLQEQFQTTLVLVTHDETLAQRCQQHYRMENGVLV